MKNKYVVFALVVCGLLAVQTVRAASITLTGTIRDFYYAGTATPPLAGHPDFENALGDDRWLFTRPFGLDGPPVYSPPGTTTATTHGEGYFNEWYHDAPGTNLSQVDPITLSETCPRLRRHYI